MYDGTATTRGKILSQRPEPRAYRSHGWSSGLVVKLADCQEARSTFLPFALLSFKHSKSMIHDAKVGGAVANQLASLQSWDTPPNLIAISLEVACALDSV